jgi:hypothetical protein
MLTIFILQRASGWRTGTQDGIAIVRVVGREEETFAAYQVRPTVGAGYPAADGVMIFALTPANGEENDWRFQIARASPRKYKATMEFGVLRLEYPDGAVDQWDRWFPE